MLSFHATLHARPTEPVETQAVELNGTTYQAITLSTEAIGTPFDVSFEQAYAALEQLPRMFIEPDGSFVWTSAAAGTAWQLDGVLYDRNGRLLHVDLKGTCPVEALEAFLAALGWPAIGVLFELMHEGVLLDEQQFRKYASTM